MEIKELLKEIKEKDTCIVLFNKESDIQIQIEYIAGLSAWKEYSLSIELIRIGAEIILYSKNINHEDCAAVLKSFMADNSQNWEEIV